MKRPMLCIVGSAGSVVKMSRVKSSKQSVSEACNRGLVLRDVHRIMMTLSIGQN